MEYRVLGTLEVLRDGEPVDLGAFRQRAMLAMLLTAPNAVFSTDRLIDGLWDGDGSADRQNSLWVYVSGLRKALEPDREKRSEGTILLTRAPGYLLQCDPDEIDAVRFERMIAEGRGLAATDPAAASLVFGEALALWRGRAFEDFTYESFAQTEIARLEALRLEAVEARIDADLDRGLSRELVSELETLVRQHPLQERLTGQLMLALYRSGRQADALRSFQRLGSRLGEELGVEPSNAIRRLEEQIVVGDPSLDVGVRASLPGAGPDAGLAVRGYELREKIGEGAFGVAHRAYQPAVGREVAIKVIKPELANDPDFIRHFETEAQHVARLEHPHIVPLYDYWREPDAAYLVMRLLTGGTLADLLERRALALHEADRLLEQVGSALHAAHRAGVVHRDITPHSILIDDEGNAYLSDFGIAIGADSEAVPAGAAAKSLGPPYASPEALERGDVSPSDDLYSLGVVMAQALTGLSGEVVQVRGALPPPALRVIDRATAPEVDDRYGNVAAFIADMHEVLAGPGPAGTADVQPTADLANPYKGLRAFDAVDSADFYGRDRLVERLVARLGEPGTRGRFVALVGPSGSGKSSVVRAGLLPALRAGALPLSDRWFTVAMTPAPHPFEELEEALLGIAVDPPKSLLEQIAGDRGLHRALGKVMPEDGSQLLLVIDQFEELFTQVDPETARRFLDVLAGAITDPKSRLRVVVTLRADFYDRPLRHRGIGELLRDGTEAITPMTPEELERAISGPVEPVGVTFEPALLAQLVHDVVDHTGALPLLQYTLTELFDARQGHRITDATYREMGGVSGALVARADGLLARLGDQAHDATRQVFLRLVTLGEGADDTRRRVLRSELEELAIDREVLDGVLDTFGRHRLLSFDRDPVTRSPTVEISHEALLTEWTRLRDWIDGARHDVRNQRRLAEAMGEWVASGHDDAYLLRGGRLEQLHGWATTTSLPLSEPEQAFLDASVAERDRAELDDRERERRAVDAELRERHRARQLAVAGTAGVLVAVLAVFGIWQWRVAAGARAESDTLVRAKELVTASAEALSTDSERALLLAIEAVYETEELGFATEEAVDAVHWALQAGGVQYDVDRTTPVAVRSGPTGLAGVYALSPAELVSFAEASVTRSLTDEECREFLSGDCPSGRGPVDDGISLRFGDEAYGAVSVEGGFYAHLGADGPLAGTRVEFAGTSLRGDTTFTAQLERFTELTGIEVDHVSSEDQDLLNIAVGDLELPDVVAAYARIPPWARGRAMNVEQIVSEEVLRDDFSDHLLGFVTVPDATGAPESEAIRGIPIQADLKGMVYYNKPAFAAAGYTIPATWNELMELSNRIVADGGTPWCFGFASGFASGWPGTDLIENLVLRTADLETYDAWTRGEVGFNSPEILTAGRLADQLMFGNGFVRNGPESVSNEDFFSQLWPMLERDPVSGEPKPDCWMHTQSDVMMTEIPLDRTVGVDLDFFMLPPVDPAVPTPVVGASLYSTGVVDRPEVRVFLDFVASPAWGQVWAADPAGRFVSANRRFDDRAIGGGGEHPAIPIRRRMAEIVREAIAENRYRFDGSDLMPVRIGGWNEDFTPGPFWQGMIDWVDGSRTIEEVFSDIDERWAELRAEGAA